MTSPTDRSSPAARLIFRSVAVVTLLFFISYAVDLTWYHMRLAAPPPLPAHPSRLRAPPDKGNKTESQIDAVPPEKDFPGARTISPPAQPNPCWYFSRHAKDPISM